MGNIGQREKYYLMLLGIVVVVVLVYFFGIRNLGAKHEDLVAERTRLEEQLAYYEALKTQNAETQAQIDQIREQIADEEARFLPFICSEAIEQYVLKTFEDAGCPYLVSVTATDVAPATVTLPNGSSATDTLLDKRISVQYCTTDGYNIPEYNRSATVISNGVIDEAAFNAYLDEMYWHGADSRVGYTEFLSALATLEEANPDCIKINSISISSEAGYILLNAEIDFFSATFYDRVSEPDTDAPYITWAGATNINTTGGFIGYPFIVEDPNSEWFMIMMTDSDAVEGQRPFATYYSNAIFTDEVNSVGLASVLDLDGVGGGDIPADEVPAD
ncbi:MAG: type II secretion system protein M [Clostridiales bacterium]|nr:type II secretion system protein M [Clostridiales bacterium]